jgi:hypothetical protein
MRAAEPLIPEASSFEVENVVEKHKRYKSPGYRSNSVRTDPSRR